MHDLTEALFSAGLIQFGAFEREGIHAPYRLRLDLLPSYPTVLNQAAGEVAGLITSPIPDRLICTRDAVALATLVSQILSIPLVLHSGTLGNPSVNLIGAYDVGHLTSLISSTTSFPPGFIARLLADARGVGLNISQWMSLIETSPAKEIRHVASIHLCGMAEHLAKRRELSQEMASRVSDAC